MSTKVWLCERTFSAFHSGQRERTANAMFFITENHGMSAWPWNTTPRSRLGPAISRLSMIASPEVGCSSPASTLRMVVLPQPEWPMMQTNSPRSMPKWTSSNTTASGLPPEPAKTFFSPWTWRKLIRPHST